MGAGAQIDWQNDPGFQQLPAAEKHKALLAIDPDYKALPPREQAKALDLIQYGKPNGGTPENYGFTLGNMGSQAWGGVKELAGGAYGMGKDVLFPEGTSEADKIKWLAKKYIFDPSDVEMQKAQNAKTGWESVAHSVAGTIPLVGPWAASIGEQAGTGDIGGAVARGGSQVVAGELAAKGSKAIPGAVKATAKAATEGMVPTAQKYLNIGPDLTERAVQKSQAEAAETQSKYQEKLEAARGANEAAKQSYLQRQQLQTEVMGHASELADHLPELAERERAVAKSLYPDIEGTADASELSGKLQDAIDSKLQGSEKAPAILTRILKELEPEDPLAGYGKGARTINGTPLDELPPAARSRILQSLSESERAAYSEPAGMPLDFERVHGYYSELGREMANKDLPGDERAAMANARGVLEQTMRKMAEGDKQLGRFVEAQKNWKQYENTFNKSWSDSRGVASPVARALQAKNPATGELIPERVAQILSEPKNYKLAQELLGKFKGAKTDVLQLMREKLEQAGTLPKTLKETPLPERPTEPAAVDPQALKAQALHDTAQGMRSPPFGGTCKGPGNGLLAAARLDQSFRWLI